MDFQHKAQISRSSHSFYKNKGSFSSFCLLTQQARWPRNPGPEDLVQVHKPGLLSVGLYGDRTVTLPPSCRDSLCPPLAACRFSPGGSNLPLAPRTWPLSGALGPAAGLPFFCVPCRVSSNHRRAAHSTPPAPLMQSRNGCGLRLPCGPTEQQRLVAVTLQTRCKV